MDSYHLEKLSYGNFNLLNMSRVLIGNDIIFFSVNHVLFFPYTSPEGKQFFRINPFGKMFLDILHTNQIRLIGFEEESERKNHSVYFHLLQENGLSYVSSIIYPGDLNLSEINDGFFQSLHEHFGQKKKIGFLSRRTILYAKLHQLDFVKYVHPMANPRRIPKKKGITHSLFFSYGTFFANTTLFNGTIHSSIPYEDGFGRFSLLLYDFCFWLKEHAVKEGIRQLIFSGDSFLSFYCFQILFPSFPSSLVSLEADSDLQDYNWKQETDHCAFVLWKPVGKKQALSICEHIRLPFFSFFPLSLPRKEQEAHSFFLSYVSRNIKGKRKKSMEKACFLLSRKEFSVIKMNGNHPLFQHNNEDDFQLSCLDVLHNGIFDFMNLFPDELKKVGDEKSHQTPDPSVLLLMERTFYRKKHRIRKDLRNRLRRIPLARKYYKKIKSFVLACAQKKKEA